MNTLQRAVLMLVVGILPLTVATVARSEIYKWTDEQGRMHFQDQPPQEVGRVADLEVRESSPVLPPDPTPAPLPAPNPPARGDAAATPVAPPRKPPTTPKVELYTVSWCPWCRKARELFRTKGVSVTEYDIEKDAAAAARMSQLDRGQGVPFAVVNGVKIRGYSPEAYSRALRSPAP